MTRATSLAGLLGELVSATITSVTNRDTLLAAILEDPADDTARLVLADLSRESDDPDAQALGRFLWAGVTASRFRDADVIEDSLYYTATGEIPVPQGNRLSGSPIRIGPRPLTKVIGRGTTPDRVGVRIGDSVGMFVRGMLANSRHARELVILRGGGAGELARRSVIITAVPGLVFAVESPGSSPRDWFLAARLRVPRRNVALGGRQALPPATGLMPRPDSRCNPAPDSGSLRGGNPRRTTRDSIGSTCTRATGRVWPTTMTGTPIARSRALSTDPPTSPPVTGRREAPRGVPRSAFLSSAARGRAHLG